LGFHSFSPLLLYRGAPRGAGIPRRGLLDRLLAHDAEDILLHVGDALFHVAVLVLIPLLAHHAQPPPSPHDEQRQGNRDGEVDPEFVRNLGIVG